MRWRRLLFLAGRMAYRDVRASPAKFLATLGFVAVAAAGVFAARGITAGVEDHLADQSREWIAADAAVVYFGSPPTEEQWNIVQGWKGVRATLVTEGGALVTSPSTADPATVALKAVDPAALSLLWTTRAQVRQGVQHASGCFLRDHLLGSAGYARRASRRRDFDSRR